MSTFLFNFKKQFAPLVESGIKTQTIRQTRKDNRRPKPGDIAACYTGLRTRNSRLLRSAPVVRCRAVRMHLDDRFVVVDGQRLSQADATAFAQADGFHCLGDMLDWFGESYEVADKTFEGFVTEWKAQA